MEPIRIADTSHSSQVSERLHKRQDYAAALGHLCLMKRQATFTTEEAACWISVLQMYPPTTVNRACVALGLSVDPFPDLSKVVAMCEHIEAEKNPQVVRGTRGDKPSTSMVENAARALGLEI